MTLEEFMAALAVEDEATPIHERNTLVAIHLPSGTEYKFMSSAGAVCACMEFGPIVSLVC